jgi:hypothetical protein
MEYLMKANGFKEKEKASEHKFGLTAANTLGNGRIIKPMEKELFIMLMEIFIRENGSMIKLVAKEHILTKTAQSMSVNGKTTNSTDSEFNNG